MAPKNREPQSLLKGALVLSVSTLAVKLIGVLYKIPLTNMMGAVGRGYFDLAYDLYIPIYTISMAGLPVAVSKMVSQQAALGRFRDVRLIFKTAARLFLLTGTVGTLLLLLLAYPYALFSKTREVVPSVIAITPSIFFCCMMSIYRGYHNGLRNMNPTAVSQVAEAVGKVIFGLLASRSVISYGWSQFRAGRPVFGKAAATEAEALSAIYPYAAAAAAIGVTLGTVVGLIYLVIRHRVCGDGITRERLVNSPRPLGGTQIAKTLIAIAVPVVTSSIVFSLTNLIDSVTIQNRLESVISGNMELIKDIYAGQLAAAHVLDADVKDFLYGAYTLSLDFRNLIPSLTMTLGVSAIPVLSAAFAVKDKKGLKTSVESVLRVTLALSLPAGIGMGVLARPILDLCYETGKSAPAISIAAPIMAAYGYTVFLMALSQPMTNMLQATGRATVPVKSLTLGALVKIAANYIFIGIPRLNINGAVIGTVLCFGVVVLCNYIALIKTVKVRVDFTAIFLKPLFSALLCGVAAHCAYGISYHFLPKMLVGGHSLANLFASLITVAAAVLVYALSMLLTGGIAKDDIIMLPKGEKIAKALAKYGFIE